MRSEQEFNSALLSICRLRRLRENHHALFHFIRASGFEFGHELDLGGAIFHHELTRGTITHRATDLHETHTAHTHRLKFGMMTKDGDINTDHLRSIGYNNSVGNRDLFSIYCKRNLFTHEAFTTLSKSCLKRSMLVT